LSDDEKKKSDLIPRLIVAVIGIPVLLTAAIKGPNWGLWVVVGGAGMIGAHEMLSMSLRDGFKLGGWLTFAGISLTLTAMYWSDSALLCVGLVFTTLLASLLTETFADREMDAALSRVQAMMMSFVYVCAFFGGYLLLFRHSPQTANWEQQAGWFLFPMFIIWAGDTGAYFAGKQWGRHKLAPTVSPAKSWEGAAGGIAASIVSGYAAWALFMQGYMNPAVVPLYVIPAAILGQLGDLAESMIKRGNGVKDSGTILYGHGGMLDRVDALVVAAPYILFLREILDTLG
jgi:phosphatidate cytidylyltransferase